MRALSLLLLLNVALAAPGTRTAAEGEKLFLKGEYRRAAVTYQRALDAGLKAKDAATARWMIARSHEEAGEYGAALSAFEAAREQEEALDALREIKARIDKLSPLVLGSVRVRCPAPGVTVEVAGRKGLPCAAVIDKLRGDVRVTARIERWAWPTKQVRIKPGQTVDIALAPPATLRFPADATSITVDSHEVGAAPVAVRVPPGQHQIMARAPGQMSWQRMIEVAPGDERTFNPWNAVLDEAPGLSTTAPPPAAETDPTPWILGGAGAAAVGVGVYFFVLAGDSIAEGDDALEQYNSAATAAEGAPFRAQVEDADADAFTRQIIGGSLLSLGVALGGVALWWALDTDSTPAAQVTADGVGWAF